MSHVTLNHRRATSMALSLLCLLAGCAIPPKDTPLAEMKPIGTYETGKSLLSTAAQWPSDHWWEAYKDKQLNQLMKEGLSEANDMRLAQARLKLAKAATGMSRASLLPNVGAQASLDQERQSYHYLMDKHSCPKAGMMLVSQRST